MAQIHEFVTFQKRGVISLPAALRERFHADEPGAQLEFIETETGEITVRGVSAVPAEQKWFWAERWQAMEREADADIAEGRIIRSETMDEFFSVLDRGPSDAG